MNRRPLCRPARFWHPRRHLAYVGTSNEYRGATWRRDPGQPRRGHLWATSDVYFADGDYGIRQSMGRPARGRILVFPTSCSLTTN